MGENIITYISQNYTWIFSGIGVFILSVFIINKQISRRSKATINNIGVGNNLLGMVFGNVHINDPKHNPIQEKQEINPYTYRNSQQLSDVHAKILNILANGPTSISRISYILGCSEKQTENVIDPLRKEGIVVVVENIVSLNNKL